MSWMTIADALETELRAGKLDPEDYVSQHPVWPSADHVLGWRLLRGRSMTTRELSFSLTWGTRRWLRAAGLMLPAGGDRRHRQWTTVQCCRETIEVLDDVALATGALKSYADRIAGMREVPCDCSRCKPRRSNKHRRS